MTPEATDLLRGARRTLADVVLPALRDDFAIEQLKVVLRVLTHLEAVIDEAYPLEAAEAEDLRRFLSAVARSGEPALSALAAPTENSDASPDDHLPAFRKLRDGNVQRKRVVTEVIHALSRAPRDAASAPVRAALEDLVRRQLERERRWTSPKRSPR